MEEELKIKKKEIIMSIILGILILLFLFVVLLVVSNKEEVVTEKPFDINDVERYVRIEELDNTDYLTVYKSVNLKQIKFLNIQEVLVSNFYNKQNEYLDTLNNNIVTNKDFIDKYNSDNKIENYKVNSKIDTLVLAEVNDGILSVLYLIEDTVDYKGLTNYITNIFIDVKNNSVVSNDTLLSKYNLTKEIISKDVYNKVFTKHDETFIDKDNGIILTKVDIQEKEEEYIKVLTENFDEYIYLYFDDNDLRLKYNLNDISNKLFNENLKTETYKTLKVNIK